MIMLYLNMLDTQADKSKFEKLYYRYRNLMFYVANGILKDESRAEDAVQEAFLRIAKNFIKVGEADDTATKNFYLVIVKNVALSMGKKESLENASDEIFEKYEKVVVSDLTFEECSYNALLSEIQALPEIYKEALYLQCVYEYKVEDIAGFLDLSVSATKKRLQRGRQILKEKLGEEEL